MPKIPIRPGVWRLVERIDLVKRQALLPVVKCCDRCGQRLRYIDVLEHIHYGRRIVVGRTCSRRLRARGNGGADAEGERAETVRAQSPPTRLPLPQPRPNRPPAPPKIKSNV